MRSAACAAAGSFFGFNGLVEFTNDYVVESSVDKVVCKDLFIEFVVVKGHLQESADNVADGEIAVSAEEEVFGGHIARDNVDDIAYLDAESRFNELVACERFFKIEELADAIVYGEVAVNGLDERSRFKVAVYKVVDLLYGYIERSFDSLVVKDIFGYERFENFVQSSAERHRTVNAHQVVAESVDIDYRVVKVSYDYTERPCDEVVCKDIVVSFVTESKFHEVAYDIAYGKVAVGIHKELFGQDISVDNVDDIAYLNAESRFNELVACERFFKIEELADAIVYGEVAVNGLDERSRFKVAVYKVVDLLYGYIERSFDSLVVKDIFGYERFENFVQSSAERHRTVNAHQVVAESVDIDYRVVKVSYDYTERPCDEVVCKDIVVSFVTESKFHEVAYDIAYGKVAVGIHKELFGQDISVDNVDDIAYLNAESRFNELVACERFFKIEELADAIVYGEVAVNGLDERSRFKVAVYKVVDLLYGYIERSFDSLVVKDIFGYERFENVVQRSAESHIAVNAHQVIHEVDVLVGNGVVKVSYDYTERPCDKVVCEQVVVSLFAYAVFKEAAEDIANGEIAVGIHKQVFRVKVARYKIANVGYGNISRCLDGAVFGNKFGKFDKVEQVAYGNGTVNFLDGLIARDHI